MVTSIYNMYSNIITAPLASLSEFQASINEFGELVISAKDADGNDISRAGLAMPPSPFCLTYNATTKDWQAIPLRDYPNGYQLVQTVIGVDQWRR